MVFFLCLLFDSVLFANETHLQLGKTVEGSLAVGETYSFTVTLNAEDFVQIKFDPRGKELVVISYGPSGYKLRGTVLGPNQSEFNFVADSAGTYRVDVTGKEKTSDGPFMITLERIVTLAERLAPPKPAYESPQIKALRSSVEAGKQGSIDAFWAEIKKNGTPLMEPLAGDDKNMLVTFLWRGASETHNVFVLRFPYAAGKPDDYYMARLGGTDLWYKTVKVGKQTRFAYTLAINVPNPNDRDAWAVIMASSRPDPLNPRRYRIDMKSVDSPEYRGNSIVEMPDAPRQPWIAERERVPAGQVDKHRFKSALLKNEREIAVYLPPAYSKSNQPYPLFLLFDERAYLGDKTQILLVPTPTILDNLIAEKRIPPTVAILVGNVAGARYEELSCNSMFTDFLVTELLPWAHGLYNFTRDSRRTVIGGSSLGGLTATCAGLSHPETFGNVLSQSGSFWWSPSGSEASNSNAGPEPNWIARQFIAKPRLPLRFYLDAGSDEVDLSGGDNSILLTTRHLRDVLLAKGYDVHFQEFAGGHDYLGWRGTLADGLIFLIGTTQAMETQPSHASHSQ